MAAGSERGPTPQPTATPVLQVGAITKIYRMGDIAVPALREVNLQLFAAEFVVIVGASGSGKSTLLNILGGLDTPTSGTVRYLVHELNNASERALTRYRREHVGFVFQFFNLLPSLTALENVELVTEIADRPRSALEVLDLVGLSDRLRHFPAQLSGGEQQRVAIARALAKRPDVLLCDEPTGSLDFPTGRRVLEVLEQANRELGTLIVVITHNVAIGAMGTRVIRMSSGRVSDVRINSTRATAQEVSW